MKETSPDERRQGTVESKARDHFDMIGCDCLCERIDNQTRAIPSQPTL